MVKIGAVMWNYKYNKTEKEKKFNIMTADIIKKHCKDYHSIFELGAGTGQLSKLLYDAGKKPMVIDDSESACNYMKQYFEDTGAKITIVKGDIFEFYKQKYEPTFGMVISSGLIEHFCKGKLKLLVDIHKSYSMKYLVIIVPHATQDEINFAKSERCMKQYGLQIPYKAEDLNKLFEDDNWKSIHTESFYTQEKLLISIFKKK